MNPSLHHLYSEMQAVITSLPDSVWDAASAGKWSGAQILEHLFLTYKNTNKGIAKCLAAGEPLATHATFQHRLRRLVVIGFGHMPTGAMAPERVVPRGMPFAEVRANILDELTTMDAGFAACTRQFGVKTRILDHPILGPLTCDEWCRFHWVHGEHHLRQIRERHNP